MPGNRNSGMLENLVLDTVNGHPVKIESEKYIEEVKSILENNDTYSPPRNENKAKLFAFLAGMEEYAKDLGIAAQKGYFDLNAECLRDIKSFINSFDELPSPS